jgi:membrane associated rhomboid family serine protease
MIPLKDKNPTRLFPYVNLALIAANILVFLYEVSQGPELSLIFDRFAVIPVNVVTALSGRGIFVQPLQALFTSMFLHGGWLHLGGNMLYLWVFGDNIEDKLGHLRYLVFYLIAGVFASAAYIYFDPHSSIPSVGASGAISGVLGAYILLFPKARIVTLIPIFIFLQFAELPAFIVIGLWFILQFFNGLASLGYQTAQSGGIAWWAHVGGFVAGMLLVFPLRKYR